MDAPKTLNKRDRRAIRRLAEGKSRPGTLPKKRVAKLADMGLLKTYVSTFYRTNEPDPNFSCQCCPDGSLRDKKGHGHIFCHAIHKLDDTSVSHADVLREAIEVAGVADGDEFEVIVRRTGRRPFGDRLMLHVRLPFQETELRREREPGKL